MNGQNYSNLIIDELQLTLGGDFRYISFDAFTWVKDTGIVLGIDDVKSNKKEVNIYPNPTTGPFAIRSEKNKKVQVYNESGSMVKTIEIKKGVNNADISELPKGVYIIKSDSEAFKIIKK